MNKPEKIILSVIALFSIIFWTLNHLIPMMSDDFVFHYFFYDIDVYSDKKIESVSDFFQSLYNIYFEQNGRILNHAWILIFCGLLDKWVFNLVNSIIFGLTLFLTWKVLVPANSFFRQRIWILCLVLLFYFALVPIPGDTLFWISGATNYLWPTTFCLALILYFEGYFIPNGKTLSPAWIVLAGLFLGQSHELLSISVSGALFIWFITHPKQFKGNIRYFILSFWIASITVVFSPGIIKRADNTLDLSGDIFIRIKERIGIFGALILRSVTPAVLFFTMILFLLTKGKEKFILFIKQEQITVSIILINMLFLFTAKVPFFRGYYVVSVFSFILIIKSITHFKIFQNNRFIQISGIMAMLFCLFSVFTAATTYYGLSQYFENISEQLKKSGPKAIIPVKEFNGKRHFMPDAFIIDANRYHFTNRFMSFYYGKEYIQFIPEETYNLLYRNQDTFPPNNIEIKELTLNEIGHLYFVPVKPGQVSQEQEFVEYLKKENIQSHIQTPFYKKLFRNLIGTNRLESGRYFTIEKGDNLFMVFPKKENIQQIGIPVRETGKEKGSEDVKIFFTPI
ncbi:MAG: DUF6056 family protein [Bacteroidales bacterium]